MFVPAVAVGAAGVPVKVGEIKSAFAATGVVTAVAKSVKSAVVNVTAPVRPATVCTASVLSTLSHEGMA